MRTASTNDDNVTIVIDTIKHVHNIYAIAEAVVIRLTPSYVTDRCITWCRTDSSSSVHSASARAMITASSPGLPHRLRIVLTNTKVKERS